MNYKVPGVYIKELQAGSKPIAGVGTAMPAFIGFSQTAPVDAQGNPMRKPVFVASWPEYQQKFGDLDPGFYLPYAVYGYFLNGGQSCYVQSLATRADAERMAANLVSLAAIPTAQEKHPLQLRSKLRGYLAEEITVTVADVDPATTTGGNEKEEASPPPAPAPDEFRLTVSGPGQQTEEYERVTVGQGSRAVPNLATALAKSQLIEAVKDSLSGARPHNGTYALALEPSAPLVAEADIKGDVTKRTGIGALEEIPELTMVVFPDLMGLYERSARNDADLKLVAGIQQELLAHCAKMKDRFAILDAPPGLDIEGVKRYRTEIFTAADGDRKYGALYYPWIQIVDPAARRKGKGNGDDGRFTFVPPSGHIAGVYARVDEERGVHKAPANEGIRGAIALERRIIDSEQEALNPIGVNCIRSFHGRGILIWGARTLADEVSEWRYISVRRLFNFVEESIYEGTQWVVFEPNDMDLWERVKRTVTAFLTRVWRSGALFGATADEAFYVKCDATNNPPADRNAGILNVEIGIAPVKPAEFVVFSFRQISGGGGGISE